MNQQEQLALATDPATAADQLVSLADQHIEVDRALARHPNATADLLESLIYAVDEDGDYDRAVRTAVVSHPHVSANTFEELAAVYPEQAVRNPALLQLVNENPSLVWRCAQLLELAHCPHGLIDMAFAAGEYSVMLRALQNLELPERYRLQLAADRLDAAAIEVLDTFEAEQTDALTQAYVQTYRQQAVALPYAVPVYVPFDASDTTQRAAYQVICGFPFTCQAWPWPQDSNGGHMQPIAQIDLAKAGQTLGENLGDGLLQVWFPTDPASGNEGSWNPLVRVVPREALSDPLDGFYPENAPWLRARENADPGECLFGISEKKVPSARVEWVALGRMYPNPLWVTCDWCDGNPAIKESTKEKLRAQLESLPVPSMDTRYLDPKSQAIHLGGYVRGHGNEADLVSWTDDSRRLLFYVNEEEGIFALAVTFHRDESGKAVFRADLSSDH